MNVKSPESREYVAFNRERILAFSSLLRGTASEVESCVRGASMGSALPDGSRIHIRFSPAKAGQVVTYVAKDRLVAHRLVQTVRSHEETYLITRGDATVCCDVPIRISSVIGIVTEFQNSGAWQPIGQAVARSRGFQLISSALTGLISTLLRLNPRSSCWAASSMISVRWAVIRLAEFAKRLTLRPFSTWRGGPPPLSQAPSGFHSEHPVARYYRDFSAEQEFLLQLLGRRDSVQETLLLKQATQIDWTRLFSVTPPNLYAYLGYKLAELGLEDDCPASLWEQTLNARRLSAAQWLRFRFELRHLVEAFTKHNVDLLLLKGSVIAFAAYPDHSLRPMSDIDLLVRPEGLEVALRLIHAAGFRCPDRIKFAHPVTFVPSIRSRCGSEGEHSCPLEKPGTRALIEVHTQLETTAPLYPVSAACMWEIAEEGKVDGLQVRTLERHEFLFHLVLHLAEHHLFEQGLRPLLDVHLWVELHRDRLNWDWIASETVRRGYGDWVYLTLKITRDTFGTPIPASFFNSVPLLPEFERLQSLAYEQIWAERCAEHKVPGFLSYALSQPSIGKSVYLLLSRVWPSRRGVNLSTVPPIETLGDGGLVLSLRRSASDVRMKIPLYFRALRNGSLGWSSLRRAIRLAKGATEIEQILMDRSLFGKPHRLD